MLKAVSLHTTMVYISPESSHVFSTVATYGWEEPWRLRAGRETSRPSLCFAHVQSEGEWWYTREVRRADWGRSHRTEVPTLFYRL